MRRLLMRVILATIACFSLVFATALHSEAGDASTRQYRALYLSSYGYSNYAVADQLSGFEEGIGDFNLDVSYEFMDAGKYYGSIDISNFDTYLRYKIFSTKPYDIVIVADDPALRYAINNRSKLFADAPLVFMGVNNQTEAVTASAMKNATGIAENLDFEGNYALMKELFPNRDHMVVIVDSSTSGQGDYVEFMKFKEEHEELSSMVINTSYYTVNGLKKVLHSLTDNDIILFMDFSSDGENNSYSLQSAATFISENAENVPIFRLNSADVGFGVLGGISYSYYDAGVMAGQMVKRILSGESADDMPLVLDAVTAPYFEQYSMDKFGITYMQLPEGAEVFNEHKNFAKFYRENTSLTNLAIVVVILMVFIIAMLYVSNIHRTRLIRTDFLTQMPNRMAIIETLNQVTESNTPCGVIMMDVDHFKEINDTYGHQVGDEIIIGVADRLKKLMGRNLKFGRLGGDEFCAVFYEPSEEIATEICMRIIREMKGGFDTSAGDQFITVSLGCAMYPLDGVDKGKIMEAADRALYVTKEKGRDGFTLFSSIDHTG